MGLAVHGWLGLVEGGAGCGWLAGRSMAGRGWQWPAAAEVDCWWRRLISTGEKVHSALNPQRFKIPGTPPLNGFGVAPQNAFWAVGGFRFLGLLSQNLKCCGFKVLWTFFPCGAAPLTSIKKGTALAGRTLSEVV